MFRNRLDRQCLVCEQVLLFFDSLLHVQGVETRVQECIPAIAEHIFAEVILQTYTVGVGLVKRLPPRHTHPQPAQSLSHLFYRCLPCRKHHQDLRLLLRLIFRLLLNTKGYFCPFTLLHRA